MGLVKKKVVNKSPSRLDEIDNSHQLVINRTPPKQFNEVSTYDFYRFVAAVTYKCGDEYFASMAQPEHADIVAKGKTRLEALENLKKKFTGS